MKNLIKKAAVLFLTASLLASVFSGCGTAEMNTSGENVGAASDQYSSSFGNLDVEDVDCSVSDGRKIIERIYFTVQTREFDTLVERLEAAVASEGGYVESSSVSATSNRKGDNRYASYTVRIPSGTGGEFTSFIYENSTVVSKEIGTDDITSSYIDTESRISALTTEKDSLEKVLSEAKTVSDIIAVQDRLTEVISELESYKSQLNTYDNLIEYTTVSIQVYEVERVEDVTEKTVWQEIGSNLKENFNNIGYALKRVFVWLVSAIPYLLIIAVILVITVAVFKTSNKKKRQKPKKQLPNVSPTAPTPPSNINNISKQ